MFTFLSYNVQDDHTFPLKTIFQIRTFRWVVLAFIEYVAWLVTEISTSSNDTAVACSRRLGTPIHTPFVACSFTQFSKSSNWTMFATIPHFPVTALWTPPAFTVAHVSVESCFAPICADPRLIGACALYTINTAWLGTVSSVMCGNAFWNHCVIFIWKNPKIL